MSRSRRASRPAEPGAEAPPAAPGEGAGGAVLVTALVLVLLLAVKSVVWGFPHDEPDEQVYWQLTQHWVATGDYTLRGTAILPNLSRAIYDHPLFHHPWLFPALLVPFVKAGAIRAAVLVPWTGHLLAVVAVAMLGVAIRRERGLPVAAATPAFWLPLLAVALDPVLLLLSRRLWMDALLAGLGGLSVAFALLAVQRARGRGLLLASGAAAGLATLVKMPGALALPVALALVLARRRGSERTAAIGCVLAPWLLLTAPWFAVFARQYGSLVPSWLGPDAESIARFPFVRAMLERPATYYVTELALVQPLLVLLAVLAVLAGWRRLSNPVLLAPLAWGAAGLLVLSFLGAKGMGFQMRYLCPVLPALYAGLYAVMPEGEPGAARAETLGLLAAVFAGATGIVNMVTLVSDDLVDLFEMARRLGGIWGTRG